MGRRVRLDVSTPVGVLAFTAVIVVIVLLIAAVLVMLDEGE